MPFPYDSGGAPNSMQGVLVGVADVSASGQGMLRVSTMNSISVTALSANQQISAQLLGGTAFVGDVSAVQGSADQLRTSTIQGDAGLFRVSAIGGTAGDRTIVDGTTQTISATLTPVSAKPGSTIQGLVINANLTDANQMHVSSVQGDAGLLRISAIGGTAGDRTLVDGTTQTISATLTPISASPAGTVQGLVVNSFQYDAGKLLVSSKSGDANQVHVSAVQGDSGLLRTSSLNQDANFMHVSGFSPDAGLFRVSSLNQDANFMHVSGFSPDAGLFLISAKQGDAGLFRVSSIIDNGSVSAKSGDANQVHVSAVQGDAGLLRVSGFTATATNFPVSSTQGDASLLRISSFASVVTTSTGGASYFATSAGIAQLSAIKTTGGGRLYGYHLTHGAGVDQYLLVFNASATSAVTLGTTVPDLYLGVPAGTGTNVGAGAVHYFDQGIGLSNGITVAVVSAINGTTAGASAMRVNLFYA